MSKNAGQNYTWEGRLARIKAEVDEKTRTLPLVIEVPPTSLTAQAHSPYSLKPGTFVHVELIGKRVDKVYTLPRTAIHPGDLVYLNNDENLVIQPVKVLRRLNDLVYVSEGLKDEDLVITTPISIPREGAKLRLRRKEQPQGLER
jgi:multidrug efflux pump subunit AcrA (membrane-fusion protein)